MITFTHIPASLNYPPNIKGELSTLHSAVITYVNDNFKNTFSYRQHVVNVLNTLSYILMSNDSLPLGWSRLDPLNNIDCVDDGVCRPVLLRASNGSIYLSDKHINWDIEEKIIVSDDAYCATTKSAVKPRQNDRTYQNKFTSEPTHKSDLYIKPPTVPRFDVNRPYRSGSIDGINYVVYTSLPDTPTKQNEISATTDVNKFTYSDLMRLYPNHFIRTRAACMYDDIPGLDRHPDLGIILPISGYSKDELIDNLIQYPHIFRLMKYVDDQIVSFYTTIEIDGELYNTSDIWESLPESSMIPKNSEFMKEYVVRRYILERDIRGVEHKYKMFGTLQPFLTLFTSSDDYIRLGYPDTEMIARKCVEARVSYKSSRNPILRRLDNA